MDWIFNRNDDTSATQESNMIAYLPTYIHLIDDKTPPTCT